jgi:hypothetical protein
MMMSDLHGAIEVLVADGATREDATAAILADPGAAIRLAPRIAELRERQEQERADAAAAEFMASPEGLLKQGRDLRLAEQARAEAGADAKALLRAKGHDPAEVEAMSATEALHVSGIEYTDELASPAERDARAEADPDAELNAERAAMTDGRFLRMSDDAQEATAQRLYGHSAEVERARREAAQWQAAGRDVPADVQAKLTTTEGGE